jgi:ABC-type uncharacterized transport system substrate-binding protein
MAMRRRDCILLICGAAAMWPLTVRAHQLDRVRRIRVLIGQAESDREAQSWIAAFREELRKHGWTEGRNIESDTRWATDVESMKRFAKEFVALQPDLIVTISTPATAAMLQQTRTIPILFVLVADPVGSGFVANLSRPGGNVTGFTPIVATLGEKWVELLKEIAPGVAKVVVQSTNGDICRGYTPSRPQLRPATWRRSSHLFMTCPRSNTSLPSRHASRIVA